MIRCALLLAAAAAVEYDVVLLGEQNAEAVVAFRWRHDDRTPLAELAETFCAAHALDAAAAATIAERVRPLRPLHAIAAAGATATEDSLARLRAAEDPEALTQDN